MGSKPYTNLLDISVQVCLDRPKGCRTEDVCGNAMRRRGREGGATSAQRYGKGVPNIVTRPLEAWRNWSVSTPSSIGTSANDCQSDQPSAHRGHGGMDGDVTFGRVSKKVAIRGLRLGESVVGCGRDQVEVEVDRTSTI